MKDQIKLHVYAAVDVMVWKHVGGARYRKRLLWLVLPGPLYRQL